MDSVYRITARRMRLGGGALHEVIHSRGNGICQQGVSMPIKISPGDPPSHLRRFFCSRDASSLLRIFTRLFAWVFPRLLPTLRSSSAKCVLRPFELRTLLSHSGQLAARLGWGNKVTFQIVLFINIAWSFRRYGVHIILVSCTCQFSLRSRSNNAYRQLNTRTFQHFLLANMLMAAVCGERFEPTCDEDTSSSLNCYRLGKQKLLKTNVRV